VLRSGFASKASNTVLKQPPVHSQNKIAQVSVANLAD
jgi:hypothetical protein